MEVPASIEQAKSREENQSALPPRDFLLPTAVTPVVSGCLMTPTDDCCSPEDYI